jgi:hypothetical protein
MKIQGYALRALQFAGRIGKRQSRFPGAIAAIAAVAFGPRAE